jgi:pyruvate kinase
MTAEAPSPTRTVLSQNTLGGITGLRDFQSQGKRVRHCKIVGTLGPASSEEGVLRELIEAGLNIARLNFSHGTHEQHRKNIETVRRLARESGRHVALLQDLQGPKIRVGKILGDGVDIITGKTYALAYGVEQTTPDIIPIDYRELVHDVHVGQRVLMDDGLLSCKIERIEGDTVYVTVLEGGRLKSRKGVNFPDSKLSIPALTEKDSRDLLFGVSSGVDFVALSFVQDPDDVMQVKRMIQALGSDIPVIAKIEMLSAMEEIDEICRVSDGIMVARGDLGVEGSVERVPGFQKRIIEAATRHARPVIIATQMLESMIENPVATLAEIADVANGVLDGADCVMLSGEVASGKYPVKCVKQMSDIINEVEAWTFKNPSRYSDDDGTTPQRWEEHQAIARAACEAADALGAKAIVCMSLTGAIARTIARWRPKTPVIAISPRKDVIQRLVMVWGVYGMQNPLFYNTDVLLQDVGNLLKELGVVTSGDTIVITAGIPINQMRPTNMIKINRIP